MLSTQYNAYLHALATVIVIILGIVVGHRCLGSRGAQYRVWVSVRRRFAGISPLVEKAKDVAAGPVLIYALGALIIGIMVVVPTLSSGRSRRRVQEKQRTQDFGFRIEKKGSEFSKSNELKLPTLGVPIVPLSFWRRGASLRHFTRGLELGS